MLPLFALARRLFVIRDNLCHPCRSLSGVECADMSALWKLADMSASLKAATCRRSPKAREYTRPTSGNSNCQKLVGRALRARRLGFA